ncbi:MAG: rRNA maturation RNase YbeY [Oscillospiraceae bacterium]|nr:rRNA maturation RNase YbeY [Oscillospiraceae bacterium]
MADIYRVYISNRQNIIKIPIGLRMMVRRSCNAALKINGFFGSAEVNVIFTDNSYIQSLNEQYRNKNSPTDVLSFPASKDGEFEINPEIGTKILGDIVVSLEMACERSRKLDNDLQREVVFLVVHGMLHLLGYDHEGNSLEKGKMKELEERILASIGFPEVEVYV